MSSGYKNILCPKNRRWKISNIFRDFKLYRVFMFNFLCQNAQIFSLYILLTRRINSFWSEDIDTVCSRGIGTFCYRKAQTKIDNIYKDFLNYIYINFSCIIVNAKLYQNSHFAYYLHTSQTTYYLTNPY